MSNHTKNHLSSIIENYNNNNNNNNKIKSKSKEQGSSKC